VTDSLKPFLSLWIAPRDTIRRLIDTDPTRYVIGLAMLRGGLGRLEIAWFSALSRRTPLSPLWPVGVAIGVALGAIVGVIGLYVGAWLVGFFCRILGGVSSAIEMRAALAWSHVPGITAATVSIALVLLGTVSPPEFKHSRLPVMTGSTIELMLLNAVLIGWGVVVQLNCIGEVNRFSAWRALGAIVLMIATLSVLILLFAYFTGGLSHSAMATGC
jgi:xanthosine utilization system XapX-like protein